MKIFDLARLSIDACETEKVDYMLTGAFATSCYGIPRATRDVDFVISIQDSNTIDAIIAHMKDEVDFGEQVQFDTLTWGKRHIGNTKCSPFLKVELFELFDDPFVEEQFRRRRHMVVPTLDVKTYVPTAEDVVVQKLRWARDKDLADALDILIVQEPQKLDMDYVSHWCKEHGTEERLSDALARIPED